MKFEEYYFFPGFTTNFDKELSESSTDVFCTDGTFYTSNTDIELKKKNNFDYDVYDKDKINGLYIKKDFFTKRNLKIMEFNDYYFIPFFTFEGNNLDRYNSHIHNLKNRSENIFFSLGFNTLGEIKYNIKPFNKWKKIEGEYDYVPGTYIRKYPKNKYLGKGIVICVTEKNNYHKLVICLIQIIRYLGCNLHIELFYGNNELTIDTFNLFNRQKNVKCININKYANNFDFSGYQIKSFSILYSSFEDVILLDADSIVFRNLEDLFFDRDYLDNGNLFFVDQQNKKIHKNNTIKFINSNIDSNFTINYSKYNYEQCSSLILFNKRKKWLSILGICGLNYDHKNTYKYLFGDKDTFWLGCKLFNQKFYLQNKLGILTYPKKIKNLRKDYSEKNGGSKVIGDGDKIFVDDNDEPIHLNQFKMDTKNDILHNTSWNFYLWDKLKICDNGKSKYLTDIDDIIFKIILKYHNFYLKLCNPSLKPPLNLYRYQTTERVSIIKRILYDTKMEDLNRIVNSDRVADTIEGFDNNHQMFNKMIENNIENKNGNESENENGNKNESENENENKNESENENKNESENENKNEGENENENEGEKANKVYITEINSTINFNKNIQDNDKNKNDNSMSMDFNAMNSHYTKLKQKLISLEKENNYLQENMKKMWGELDSLEKENKSMKNKINQTDKNEKLNKQLLKKISILNSEIKSLKNRECKNISNEKSEFTKLLGNEEIYNEGEINEKNLHFFDITNSIKKQFEFHIIEITQIQKAVITHINSEEVNDLKDWEEILRNISNFRNKKIKEDFINKLESSIILLINIAKFYTKDK